MPPFPMRNLRRVMVRVMKSVKVRRVLMVDAGGVGVVDGGVGAAAMMSCQRVRGRLTMVLMPR